MATIPRYEALSRSGDGVESVCVVGSCTKIGGIGGEGDGVTEKYAFALACVEISDASCFSAGRNKCIDWKKANTAPSTVMIMVKMEAQKLGITFR